VQLPPVRTRGVDFRTLLDEKGEPVGPERLAARREALVGALTELQPDAVLTELFPFGRRVLVDEFLAVACEARARRPRPLLLSSVRDVLAAPQKPERAAETHRRLADFYDGAFVHGDPALVPLDASWPVDASLRPLLRYTGYVDEGGPADTGGLAEAGGPVEAGPEAERVEVVVSGGSSAAALPLLRAAARAAARHPDRPWRLLVGGGIGEADVRDLRAAIPANATVERARPDFRALLARAAVSVSQAGYNTVVDLLRAGPRALLVPFEAGRETEQRLRAEALAARGLAAVLPEAELTGEALAGAVARVLASPRRTEAAGLRLDGAAETVATVEGMLRERPPHPSPSGRGGRICRFHEALRRAEDAGVRLEVWWRDDDAVAATPALERLLGLARRHGLPLALAAIPARVQGSLAPRLGEAPGTAVLVHGLAHANHAPLGARKAEFGPHRPLDAMTAELADALRLAIATFGPLALPVLAPPWNRIAPALVPALPGLGYAGLSTFGPRPAERPAPGLLQINSHIDPIDWRGDRGLRDRERLEAEFAEAIAARIAGLTDEPIGLLTHHGAHDEAIWSFCEHVLERLSRSPAVRYPFVGVLFSRDRLPLVTEP
jgi:predicted glycosyltransferase